MWCRKFAATSYIYWFTSSHTPLYTGNRTVVTRGCREGERQDRQRLVNEDNGTVRMNKPW